MTRRALLATAAATAALGVMPTLRAADHAPAGRRGVNIPLWFDQEDGSDLPPTEAVLTFLREQGFDAIRLPLSPPRFARGDAADLTALADSVRRLQSLGLNTTLDLHPQGEFRDALEAGPEPEQVLVDAWSNLSGMTGDLDPNLLALELLNEPPMWQDRWLPLRQRLVETVREKSAHHIIWGANRYQRIDETLHCPPLVDGNSSVAIHYYSPMEFTHQCQNWGGQTYPAGTPFPQLDWGVAEIDRDFAQIAQWSAETGIAVTLNEFGTLGFCSDATSRALWTRSVRQAAERHGFGWAYWELDRGFGFLQGRDTPVPTEHPILQSLLEDAA